MPAFNAEKYISKSIHSIINQNHKNFELLIINDGSTDDTEIEILKFNDSRIKYFKQNNNGVSSARNVGLENMKGDYFCFLDSDDIMSTVSISSRLLIFSKNQDATFVDGVIRIQNSNLNKTLSIWKPKVSNVNPKEYLTSLSDKCFLGQTWLIKNEFKTIRFNESLSHCEDLLFFILLSNQGGKYYNTDEEILIYRKHSFSAMTNLDSLYVSYKRFYFLLKKNKIIMDYTYLIKRINSIMLKSYLKKYKLIRACKMTINYIFEKFIF